MQRLIKKHGSRRRFSEELKMSLVKEYEEGKTTIKEISRQYHVSSTAVYKWLKKYSYFEQNQVLVVEKKESQTERLKHLEQRIKSLEQEVGRTALEKRYLEMVLSKASEYYEVDLKKISPSSHRANAIESRFTRP